MRHSLFWTIFVTMSASSFAGTYRDLAMGFVKEQKPCEESSACAMTTADFCDSAGMRYALLTNWVQKVEQWRHDEIKKSALSYFTGASGLPLDELRRAETQVTIDAVNLRNWSKSVGEAVTRASGGSSGLWAGGRVMNGVLVEGISRWLGLADNPEMSIEGNIHACAMKRLKARLDLISCSDAVSWFSASAGSSHVSVSNGIVTAQLTLTPRFPQYRTAVRLIEDLLSDISVESGARTIKVEDYLTPYELRKELDKAYESECDRLSRLPRKGPRFLLKSSMKKNLNYPRFTVREYKISDSDFEAIGRWCETARMKQAHVVSLDCIDEALDPSEPGRLITKLGVLKGSVLKGRILPLSIEDGGLVFGLPRGPRGMEYGEDVENDNSVVLPCSVKFDDIDLSRYKINCVSVAQ